MLGPGLVYGDQTTSDKHGFSLVSYISFFMGTSKGSYIQLTGLYRVYPLEVFRGATHCERCGAKVVKIQLLMNFLHKVDAAGPTLFKAVVSCGTNKCLVEISVRENSRY